MLVYKIYFLNDVRDLLQQKPSEIFLFDQSAHEHVLKEGQSNDMITSLHNLLIDKKAKKVSDRTVLHQMNNHIARIVYGYKGKTLFVDGQGRVLIAVTKSEIRNKSIFHWSLWKVENNTTDNDKSSYFYLTEEDGEIVKIIDTIKNIDSTNN